MGIAAVSLMAMGAGTLISSQAQSDAGQYNRDMYYLMAGSAEQRGQFGSSQALAKGAHAIGGARAAAAGANVDVQSGSVVDVNAGTAAMSELDALQARSNALMEAYGLRAKGDIAKREGESQAFTTLLSGGGQMYGEAYKMIPNFARG